MINSNTAKLVKLSEDLKSGNRLALSKAITYVESTRPDHRKDSRAILDQIGTFNTSSLRIGLTGPPGVGKSTFIESLGLKLIEKGHKVAVLAIDPSSSMSGGSILGDKTRMELLSKNKNAFVRPSPNNCSLGGVTRGTQETIFLCEAAGFDVVLVETVGVGQSETMVSNLTDIFCLLIIPGSGDELQGVKRGIIELADLILINKADGDLVNLAEKTCSDYSNALNFMRSRDDAPNFPKARTISAKEDNGIIEVWQEILTLSDWRKKNSLFYERRREQMLICFDQEVQIFLNNKFSKSKDLFNRRKALEKQVLSNQLNPSTAAEILVNDLFSE